MTPPRFYPYNVGSADVDSKLHIRLTSIVNILFETAGEDARVMGFGTDRLSRMNMGWILSRMVVEVVRKPEIFEHLTVSTWLSENGVLINTRNFSIMDADSNVIVRARSTWCLLDHSSRRPVRLTVLGQNIDDALSEDAAPCPAPGLIDIPEVMLSSFAHTVRYTDIDVNDHLNSLRYIDMICNAMPRELAESTDPQCLELHFIKECHYGEVLDVNCMCDGAGGVFTISREDGSDAMEARLSKI